MTLRAGLIAAVLGFAAVAHAQTPPPDGADLYKRTCAQCHDNGTNRAPNREAFKSLPAERVLAAMETGSMITMATNRTAAERRAIAEFLTGKSFGSPLVTTPPPQAMCTAARRASIRSAGPRWNGWGRTHRTRDFRTRAGAGSRPPMCRG